MKSQHSDINKSEVTYGRRFNGYVFIVVHMSEPDPPQPVEQPQPWSDTTKSITETGVIKDALSDDQRTVLNTISEKTTYIRSNIALTNGDAIDSETIETIPNLYQAVKTAFDFAVQGTTSDFGAAGIKTDKLSFSTADDGDIVLILNELDETTGEKVAKKYSLAKIVAAIKTLNDRTVHMIGSDNESPIDITIPDEPEPEPEP